jgi:PhoD-like phosphatase
MLPWPNAGMDLAVLNFTSPVERSLTLLLLHRGTYALAQFNETGLLAEEMLVLSSQEYVSARRPLLRETTRWTLSKNDTLLLRGTVPVLQEQPNYILWSCNQPYAEHLNKAVLHKLTLPIFKWYDNLVQQLNPNCIMGLGDVMYTDGISLLDWQKRISSETSDWHIRAQRRMRQLFAEGYQRHWSFPEFARVLRNYPHVFTYDDHEFRDGWGSEYSDAKDAVLGDTSRAVAEDIILGGGPRVCTGPSCDAHQSFVHGDLAVWIFDTRTSRHYGKSIISKQQLEDFQRFLEDFNSRFLLISITVPLLYLRENVVMAAAEAGDAAQDLFGFRDDARDCWRAGRNAPYLQSLIELVREFHQQHPAVPIAFVSGDIHLANAFTFQPVGFSRPLWQITSSALTTRSHLAEPLRSLLGLPRHSEDTLLGPVKRVWDDVTEPNVLHCQLVDGELCFALKTLSGKTPHPITLV